MGKKQGNIALIPVAIIFMVFAIGAGYIYLQIKQSPTSSSTPQIGAFVAKVGVPTKTIFTASLKTNNGNKQIYRASASYGVADLQGVEGYFLSKLAIFSDSILFLDNGKINLYNKNSKEIKSIDFPAEVSQKLGENKMPSFGAEELNSTYSIIRFFDDYTKLGVYLLNRKDIGLLKIAQFDNTCNSLYCGGPRLLKSLPDNRFIFEQSGGDACWSSGVIHRYDLNSTSLTSLLQFQNGCYVDKDAFLGMIGNNLVAAKHILVKNPSANFGPNTKYTELYSIDPDGVKATIISQDSMPADISTITVAESRGIIYLSNDKDKYYSYDIGTKNLREISKTEVIHPTYPSERKPDEILKEMSSYLETKVVKKNLGSAVSVKSWNVGLRVIDDEGDEVQVLPITFLDGKFKAEQSGEKLDPMYTWRDFQNPKVIDKDKVAFTGVLQRSSTNGPQPIESKSFLINLRTGEVSLITP